MSGTEWELQFRHGNDESSEAEQHRYQRDVVANDTGIQQRAVRLLEYLEAVRGLKEQPVRDVAEHHDQRWWAGDIPAHASCVLTATGTEPWLVVSKASILPVPPASEDIIPHLRTGVTNPERNRLSPSISMTSSPMTRKSWPGHPPRSAGD